MSHFISIPAILLFIMVSVTGLAQQQNDTSDYYQEKFFRYSNAIYHENIKTVLLHRKGWEMSQPWIIFDSQEKLMLSFDDLDGGYRDYRYTVIHCDAYWNPTDLIVYKYIEGFTEDYIDNYQYSSTTIEDYTHYELEFPTEDLRMTKSGNYIIKVYEADREDDPAFTWRFMLLEPEVNIRARIKRATGVKDRNYRQEVDFTIVKAGYNIDYPYQNLKVIVRQNGRWDNMILDLQPKYVKADELDYNFEEINTFNGGNEYRNFDIKSVKYNTEAIDEIVLSDDGYHAYLLPDERRTFKQYIYYEDINGERLIKTNEGQNNAIDAEYVYVHFFLPYNAPFVNGSLYIVGDLTYWDLSPESKLKYNYEKRGYEATLYLKQGYYDYHYVFLEDGNNEGDVSVIEGNHFQTENEYTIYVYYRETGTLYDKLIGVEVFPTEF